MSNVRLVLLAFLSAVALPLPALACSCAPWPPGATHRTPFLAVVRPGDFVVVATVLRHVGRRHTRERIPEAMEVAVQEVLSGKDGRRVLRVRGDNGVLCRPYVTEFPPGTSWVIALHSAEEKRGEYAISNCAEYWLQVQADQVRGYISPDAGPRSAVEQMQLRDFAALLRGKTR
jgi:hypothetical protein